MSVFDKKIWTCQDVLKQGGWWPIFAQMHPSVKNVGWFKNNCHDSIRPIRKEKIIDLYKPWGIAQQNRIDGQIQSAMLQ